MLTDAVIANKGYAKMKLKAGEGMDRLAWNVIRRDCPDFLLPIKVVEIDGETELRYELTDGVRLAYLPKKMTKQEFLDWMIGLLAPFQSCGDWFLDYHNFVLDQNYIFVGKGSKTTVKYIYIPSASYQISDEKIKEFFTELVLDTDISDDAGYLVNVLRIIKDPDAHLSRLLEVIKKEARETNVPKASGLTGGSGIVYEGSERKQNELPQSENRRKFTDQEPGNNPSDRQKPEEEPEKERKNEPKKESGISSEFGQNDETGRLMGSLFGDAEEEKPKKKKKEKKEREQKGGGLFGFLKGKPKEKKEEEISPAEPERDNRPVQQDSSLCVVPKWESRPAAPDFLDDATSIQEEEGPGDGSELNLRLEKCVGCQCPEQIQLDLQKGFVTVGRYDKSGAPRADYNFDASLSFVSRNHFRVDRQGERWTIVDLTSTNGTYINGEMLTPNIPRYLDENDVIMISCRQRYLAYRVIR